MRGPASVSVWHTGSDSHSTVSVNNLSRPRQCPRYWGTLHRTMLYCGLCKYLEAVWWSRGRSSEHSDRLIQRRGGSRNWGWTWHSRRLPWPRDWPRCATCWSTRASPWHRLSPRQSTWCPPRQSPRNSISSHSSATPSTWYWSRYPKLSQFLKNIFKLKSFSSHFLNFLVNNLLRLTNNWDQQLNKSDNRLRSTIKWYRQSTWILNRLLKFSSDYRDFKDFPSYCCILFTFIIWRQWSCCWTCRWCRPGPGVGHCCTLSRRRGSLQTDQVLFQVPVLCRHLQIRRGPDQSWRWCSRSPGLVNDDASSVFWQEASSPLLIEHSCPELG